MNYGRSARRYEFYFYTISYVSLISRSKVKEFTINNCTYL